MHKTGTEIVRTVGSKVIYLVADNSDADNT